jgi:anti-sigma regulatory factor (Ser/Thr protein kinase)
MIRATGQPAPVTLPLAPSDARRELKALLAGTRWCREADSVVLAVHEAIVNADRHGGGAVRVDASVKGDALEVEVCDRGPGFEIPSADRTGTVSSADPFAEDGRGLWLICRIASRAETGWSGSDFCLRMRFEPPGVRPGR